MRLSYALGFGLALALVGSANAQTSAPRPVNQQNRPAQANQTYAYPTPLYRMDDVSKSLNLNNQQIEKLNQLTDKTQQTYRDQYDKLNTVGQADRAARQQELNRQYQSDWAKGARDIFNQDQLNRYQQLQYQYGGFTSLTDPDVQKRLNLTPEQQKTLRDNMDWSTQHMQEINKLGPTDREKATQSYRDYQKQYQERWNKYLTPDQQKAWREMTGEPYTFQPTWTAPRR